MARLSRDEKKTATRQSLIETGAACFARYGFAATAIDTIAEEAGFSRGAFYANFDSKDELFLLLLKYHLELELTTLQGTLNKANSGDDLIDRIQRRYRNLGKDIDWCLLLCEFQLYVKRNGAQAAAFKKLFDRYRLSLGEMIDECCTRLNLELAITPLELATSMLALAHGLSLQRATNPDIRTTLSADALSVFGRGAQMSAK